MFQAEWLICCQPNNDIIHSLWRKDYIDIKVYTVAKNIPDEKILIFEKQGGEVEKGGEVGSNTADVRKN